MIHFREAQPEDYVSIAKLHADNWKRHYRGIYSDHFLDHEVDNDRLKVWQKRLETPTSDQQIIVVVQEKTVVGLACFYLNEDPRFGSYLDNLHVAFELQNSGIGKRLLQECAQRILQKADSKKMYLWVFDANHAAKLAYDRLGGEHFETVEKETEDGTKAQVCRYVWPDVSLFIMSS